MVAGTWQHRVNSRVVFRWQWLTAAAQHRSTTDSRRCWNTDDDSIDLQRSERSWRTTACPHTWLALSQLHTIDRQQPIITSSSKTTTKVVGFGIHVCCSCGLQVCLITVLIQSVSVRCSSSGSINHSIKKPVTARPVYQASLATQKSTRWFSTANRLQYTFAKKVICDPYLWTHDPHNPRSAFLAIFGLAVTFTFDLWPQNQINSSLSLVHHSGKFGERYHSALLTWFTSGLKENTVMWYLKFFYIDLIKNLRFVRVKTHGRSQGVTGYTCNPRTRKEFWGLNFEG